MADEYRADNIFWVPKEARWPQPQGKAEQPTIGRHYPMRGYTRSNLFRMRQFYEAYRSREKVAPMVRQLPWTRHLIILGRTATCTQRQIAMCPCKGYSMHIVTRVTISGRAARDLMRVPDRISAKLLLWASAVQKSGLATVRQQPGYHDEPLKGVRHGQRSIRLSRSYRAIYMTSKAGDIELVTVEEVTKHDY